MCEKDFYRSFFAQCRSQIKFRWFLDQCGINPGAFSRFMKGEMFDYQISVQQLEKLYDMITDFCKNIA